MSAKRGGAKDARRTDAPRCRETRRSNQTDLQKKSWLEVPGKDTVCKHEELITRGGGGGGSLTLFTGCLCTQWCTGTVSSGWFIRSKQQACIYTSSILAFWKVPFDFVFADSDRKQPQAWFILLFFFLLWHQVMKTWKCWKWPTLFFLFFF